MISEEQYKQILDFAHAYALEKSGCKKVAVGSAVVASPSFYSRFGYEVISYGANKSIPNLCKSEECMRVQKYGEDSKNHRLPSDCRAIHSEVDAIIDAAQDLKGCTIVVTRYPCEACARAIVDAGITTVVYGRQQEISAETKYIFDAFGVECTHIKDWDAEDTTR